jgi:hypothetical protein
MDLPVNYRALLPHERRAVREKYVELQGGKCYFCQNDLSGPPTHKVKYTKVTTELYPEGFFDHPVHLHHDHNTDKTVGAVHARCNAVLWEYYGE